jgi:hypothetical protein
MKIKLTHYQPLTPKEIQAALLGRFHSKRTARAHCTCCAVGAVCASAVRLFNQNDLHGGEGIDDFDDAVEMLSKYFPEKQLALIEAAFEHRYRNFDALGSDELNERTYLDLEDFARGPDCKTLHAEALAIIRNEGTFKP